MNEFLKAASEYIARGWRVFPLKEDNGDGKTFKHPAISDWDSNATLDPDTIAEWFPDEFKGGIAIVAGPGFTIVDVDTKSNGVSTLHSHATDEELKTPTVQTPTGGWHLYYQTPTDREVANWVKFLPGLDLRTNGQGYVVAPPTTRDGEPYTWIKQSIPMRMLPDWVKKYPKAGQGEVKGYQDTDWIVPGEWNTKMVSIAGIEVHNSHSRDELAARLLAISETRSHPEHRHHSEADIERLGRIASDAWEQWKTGRLYEKTEEGQVELFADLFRGRVRWNWTTKKWMFYRENLWWEEDMGGKVRSYVTEAYQQRLVAARAAESALKAENSGISEADWKKTSEYAELSFARAMGSYRAQEDVWMLARKDRELGSSKIDWDQNPEFLGVKNGVVNLRTGELLKGTPEMMISKHLPLEYNPANCFATRWRQGLMEVFANDMEMADFFQRAIGYSLTGYVREQVWFLCYGGGSNGKSTILEDILLKEIFGPYGRYTRIDTFTQRNNRSAIAHDIADLDGKRFVVTSEPAGFVKLDEERIKSLATGGRTSADKKFEAEKEFSPVLKLFMETNHLPKIDDFSQGMKRRIRYIPFNVQFGEPGFPPIDTDIIPNLRAEREHILVWAVEGAVKYLDDGLKTPDKVLEATANYISNEDIFGQWIEEMEIQKSEEDKTKTESIYRSFRSWSSQNGVQDRFILTKSSFTKTLSERFPLAYKHTSKERFWTLKMKEKKEEDGPGY